MPEQNSHGHRVAQQSRRVLHDSPVRNETPLVGTLYGDGTAKKLFLLTKISAWGTRAAPLPPQEDPKNLRFRPCFHRRAIRTYVVFSPSRIRTYDDLSGHPMQARKRVPSCRLSLVACSVHSPWMSQVRISICRRPPHGRHVITRSDSPRWMQVWSGLSGVLSLVSCCRCTRRGVSPGQFRLRVVLPFGKANPQRSQVPSVKTQSVLIVA